MTRIVQIDPTYTFKLLYLSTHGIGIKYDITATLLHELGHAIHGTADNVKANDLTGDNIKYCNSFFIQLGYPELASYVGQELNGSVIEEGKSYTGGALITNAIIDRGSYIQNGAHPSFLFDSTNINLLDLGVAGSSLILGGSGHNSYVGTSSADWLYGNQGNDVLSGVGGKDTIYGGGGVDTIDGGLGNDIVYGDDENADSGLFGADTISGGGGNDTVYGEGDNDSLYGNAGGDLIYGGLGNDVVFGDGTLGNTTQTGNDKLYGDDGNDTIYGGPGSDELHGGVGVNRLEGGAGADKLVSEARGDTLNGGPGNDILELNSVEATIEFARGDGSDAVQFDRAKGTYTLKLLDVDAAEVEVLAGGFSAYDYVDAQHPNGTWYQFLTIKVGASDQITFLENGLNGKLNIGPTGTGYNQIGYNRGYNPDYAPANTYPTNEGQLDAITFKDGTTWDQATIWSHLTTVHTWAPYRAEYKDTEFLPYVKATYLQAFADYAAGTAPPPAPIIGVDHDAGLMRFLPDAHFHSWV